MYLPGMALLLTDIVRYRLSIASQEGGDIPTILKLADAPHDLMADGPDYVDIALEQRIWAAIAQETGREDIGLVCGSRITTQMINMLGYVMANAPTLRIALDKCCAYQRVIGDSMGYVVEKGADTTTIWVDQWVPWNDGLRFTLDMVMAAVPSWATANTPVPVQPIRIGFHYERPENALQYHTFFAPAPVTFGVGRSFQVYDNADLDQPIVGASSQMFGFFEDKVNRLLSDHEGWDTYTHKVRQNILAALQGTTPEIETVAGCLAVSVRKLQQKLAEEGTTFSGILSDARRDLARQYLKEGNVNNAEIAYLLGFSEVSVFSRSFKKWTGETPSAFKTRTTQAI